jgi:hypothetical protein
MPSARYYRDQARLLLQWADDAQDEAATRRLTARAQDMLAMAQTADQPSGKPAVDAVEQFNEQQLIPDKPVVQQQQQQQQGMKLDPE